MTNSRKKRNPRKKSRVYLPVAIVILIAGMAVGAVMRPWGILTASRIRFATHPITPPTAPPLIPNPSHPSKEYIYGGGKLIATEAGKSDQTITFDSILPKTYGGAAFTINATASSGLVVTFTVTSGPASVSGNTVTLTGAGTVNIRADQDGNDSFNPATSVTRSFDVDKASATISLGNLTPTYNGAAHYASATTTPSGLTVNLVYTQSGNSISSPTNAGSYSVSASISDNNYQGSASDTLVISKASALVTLSNLAQTYDGGQKSASVATSPQGLSVSVTYNNSATVPTNAGSYTVAAAINDSNYQGSASGTLVINKAAATVSLSNLTATYDGVAHYASATTTPSGVTVNLAYTQGGNSVSSPTNAGSYSVSASVSDNNYQGSTSGTLVINKAAATLSLSNLSQVYDGSPKGCTVTTNPAGLGGVTVTYNGATSAPTNVASYAVIASLTNDNYTASNATGNLVITPATPTISWTPPAEIFYGTALSSSQLNATASLNGNAVAGSFSYSPAAGTVPSIGVQSLLTTFTPTDSANLNSVSNVERHINVVLSSRSLSVMSSGSYLEAPNSSSLNITGSAITMEAWVKLPNPALGNWNYQTILEKAPASSYDGGYDLCITDQGKARLDVFYGSGSYIGLIGNSVLSANKWHHVAGVYNGSQLQIYVDGVLDGTYNTSVTIASTSASLMIGRVHYPYGGSQSFNGLIDEVRVSSSAIYTGNFTPASNLTTGATTRALWKFDGETTNDSSGNVNTGTLNGTASYSTDVPGTHSLSVTGSAGYMEAANSSSLNITGSALTMEAWVKLPNPALGNWNYQSILEKAPASAYDGGYDLVITDQGKARLDIYYGSGSYIGLIGNSVLSANKWHHVAGVYNGTQMQIYVDGVLDGTYNTSVTIASTSASLMIGRSHYPYGGSQSFNGLIDEVRVSSSVIYAGDFTPIANLTAGSSTRALWKFDGQTMNDSSGNGNTGTLNGTAFYSSDVPGTHSLSVTGGYVEAQNSPSLDITGSAITMEAWVKLPNPALGNWNYQSILEKAPAWSYDGGYDLVITDQGKARLDVYYGSGSYIGLIGNSVLSANTWHHVAGVYNGSQMQIYVDGALDGTYNTSVTISSTSASVMIGRSHYPYGGSQAFNGLIDEVRVSSSAIYTGNFTPASNLTAGATTRALWKFDGQTMNDSSGNGNKGTLNGGASYSTDVPGGNSLLVDGSSGYLEAANSSSLNITGSAITMEAWVKLPNPALGNWQYQSILEKAPASGTEGGYDLCITDQGKARLDVYYGTYYVGLIGNSVLSANRWHHVAGVYNGSQMQIYVDGVVDGTYNTSVTITSTSASLMIGRSHYPYGGSQSFNGLIDEVRVSSSVIYTGNFTPASNLTAGATTRALWKFNGQTTNDSSGNGNTGTLNGGAAYSTDVP